MLRPSSKYSFSNSGVHGVPDLAAKETAKESKHVVQPALPVPQMHLLGSTLGRREAPGWPGTIWKSDITLCRISVLNKTHTLGPSLGMSLQKLCGENICCSTLQLTLLRPSISLTPSNLRKSVPLSLQYEVFLQFQPTNEELGL